MIRGAIATSVRLLCGCRGRWHTGTDPDAVASRVYFANHASHLDAIVVWSSLTRRQRDRLRIVAAKDYWGRGRLRRWLAATVFRAELVDRTRQTKAENLLTIVGSCLDGECSVLLFPEGTRGDGAAVHAFRPGLWHVARAHPTVDLVPVWIENIGRVLPKGEILPIPILAAVTFGPPIRLAAEESRETFLERARAAVVALGEGGG